MTVRTAEPIAAQTYERYYGLVDTPFSLTPNTRYRYASSSHSDALERVLNALNRREALVVVTGEIGTGKTLLVRTVLEHLDPRTFLSVITNPLLTATDLVKQVLRDFGVVSDDLIRGPEPTRHELVRALQQFLASLVPLHAHAVVVIDEAQHLQPETLEEIRLLSNFETEETKLLQIVLIGQPNLESVLKRPEIRQLEQRISRRIELEPLNQAEVQHYIERRLWVAHGGVDGTVTDDSSPGQGTFWRVEFSRPAIRAIADISNGIPRVINLLCDRALELGYTRHARTLDRPVVMAAARDLRLPLGRAVQLQRAGAAAVAASVVVAASAAAWWTSTSDAARPAEIASGAAVGVEVEAAPVTPAPPITSPEPSPAPAADTTQVSGTSATVQRGNLVEAESYLVLVASFRSAQRANDVADQITALGLPAFIRPPGGGVWHQVAMGPYASQEEAAAARAVLERAHFDNSVVVSSAQERTTNTPNQD